MKKIIFLLLMMPLLVKAQNCITITNSITGKINKTGVVYLGNSIPIPTLTIIKQGDDYKIGYGLETSKQALPRELYIVITFANGEKKTINIAQYASDIEEPKTFFTFLSSAINDDIKYLKVNPISTINLSLTGTDIIDKEFRVSSAAAKKIMQTVSCVLE